MLVFTAQPLKGILHAALAQHVMMLMHDAALHDEKWSLLAGQGPAGGPQVPPQMMEQMQKHLSDPATADMITTFVQTMKPEDLAGILKQSGMDVTPEQVWSHTSLIRILGVCSCLVSTHL